MFHRSISPKILLTVKFYINLFHDTPKSVCRTLKNNYICRADRVIY